MDEESGVVQAGRADFEISLDKEEKLLTLSEDGETEVETIPVGGEIRGNVV
jgi:hypothetical protein